MVSAVSPDCEIRIVMVSERNDGIAITPLAGVIHFDRNSRQTLDHELAGLRGMPTGSTSGDVDLLGRLEFRFGNLHLIKKDVASILRNATQSGIAHGARLLIDFLEHEMFEAAFFRHDRVPGHVLDLADNGLAVKVGELHAIGRDHGQISIGEKEQIAGVIKNGRHIGSDEIFVLAQVR